MLQQSLGASGKQAGYRASDAVLYDFDLIYLDGHDLRGVE
jgi:bifunctional non-homologous end joining protein LigD